MFEDSHLLTLLMQLLCFTKYYLTVSTSTSHVSPSFCVINHECVFNLMFYSISSLGYSAFMSLKGSNTERVHAG